MVKYPKQEREEGPRGGPGSWQVEHWMLGKPRTAPGSQASVGGRMQGAGLQSLRISSVWLLPALCAFMLT